MEWDAHLDGESATAHMPVEVGLVGAGPWAATMHGPVLAAGPQTRLAAVWARRPDAATQLAARLDTYAARSYEELLDRCEAVAFAVPPDVQAVLAAHAARAGRALLLEKPIGLTLDEAERLADAVGAAGVVSQLVLSRRYHPATREFLAAAGTFEAVGAQSSNLSGTLLGGDFATPWRLEHGMLLDVGPHALDLLDAALGPIVDIRGTGDPKGWFEAVSVHESGAISSAVMSGIIGEPRTVVELFGPRGVLALDNTGRVRDDAWATLRREFASAVRTGTSHPLDVHRGLYLQRLIDRATPR